MSKTTELVERLRELPRDTRKATVEIYDLCVEASYEIEALTDRCARYAEEIAVLQERVEALRGGGSGGNVMERLTAHSKQTSHENGICCTHFCGPECLGVGGNCAMNCKWEEAAWSRLAAYEDTGLEPNEVNALQKDWSDLCTVIGECGGIDRLRKLAEADKAGRLVVLPCKVGDTVWITGSVRRLYSEKVRTFFCGDPSYSRGMADNGVKMMRTTGCDIPIHEFGKTVFLTREEAEKALEAMK